MFTKIAHFSELFSGKPRFYTPAVLGCSPNKQLRWRVPVTGERPITINVENLPEGFSFDGIAIDGNGTEGEYLIKLYAENRCGISVTEIKLSIKPDGVLATPLMGWTSWNAFRNKISDTIIKDVADELVNSGLADCGYRYVNIDAGWQSDQYSDDNSIKPNDNFPNMKALADYVHKYGLCIGIYSTPLTKAYGGGEYAGCTRTKDRILSYDIIGDEHYENENVRCWSKWGFDYLKYDWGQTDVKNAKLMKSALQSSDRDFGFCVTTAAPISDAEFWRENCTSWRNNWDAEDNWETFLKIVRSGDNWLSHIRPGHYFDLDMLECAYYVDHYSKLSEDEQIAAFSLRAFMSSPLQLSFDLNKIRPIDLDIICNPEVLALNQDPVGVDSITMIQYCLKDSLVRIYTRPSSHGKAYLIINIGEITTDISFTHNGVLHDIWACEDMAIDNGLCSLSIEPHTARLFIEKV